MVAVFVFSMLRVSIIFSSDLPTEFNIFKKSKDLKQYQAMPFFSNEHIKLHYYEYGNGTDILLAFHGFGMRGTQFRVLESAFSSKYKIYSFDLFFHGQTELFDSSLSTVRKGLNPQEYGSYIRDFISTLDTDGKKISLLSYSMGSLMALSILESLPESIDSVFFIAPDGFKPNKLLQIGSRNLLINRFLYKMVFSPKTVNYLLDFILKLKYIDSSLHHILRNEFKTTETRLACYNSITYHAKLSFKQNKLAEILNRHEIKSFFYFGESDLLFPASIGTNFSKKLNSSIIEVLKGGHELVNEKLNETIRRQMSLDNYDKG